MKKDIKTLNKIIGMVRDSQRETPEDKLREKAWDYSHQLNCCSCSPAVDEEIQKVISLPDALAILNEAVEEACK